MIFLILNFKEKNHVIEQVRKLYLQTLQEINNDVMNHVHVTRQLAANQIRYLLTLICDALRDLVPCAQFKKREKHPWRSVDFSKVAG